MDGSSMLFWLVAAAVTAAVVALLARPLMSGARASPATPVSGVTEAPDVQIYKDQLEELERDAGSGLISAVDADTARVEISRRLLQSAGRAGERSAQSALEAAGARLRSGIGWAVAGLVPVLSIGLYLALGSPGLPGVPYASRPAMVPKEASLSELVARVELRLREHPEDGQGWDVIAPVYFKLERFEDAAAAFTNALRILGDSPRRLAGHAEAEILANAGIVTESARRSLTRLLEREPDRPEPRFWLALAKEQDGLLKEAAAEYRKLLAIAGADAPWREMVEQRLAAAMAGGADKLPGDGKAPALTAEQRAGVTQLPAAEQTAMIEQMVAGLAERLRKDGRDADGWQRLVRSYVVLGRREEARSAMAEARRSLAADPAALKGLDALARSLGLDS